MTEVMRARVYRWAYRFLRNHDDALDATQDVLVKWLRQARSEIDSGEAWLRRTTVNHCIDLSRRRRPIPIGEAPTAEAANDEPDDETLRWRIVDALSRLSDAQRAVVVAKACDGEKFTKIAEIMGVSASTVKTHYIRGLRALRASLADIEED